MRRVLVNEQTFGDLNVPYPYRPISIWGQSRLSCADGKIILDSDPSDLTRRPNSVAMSLYVVSLAHVRRPSRLLPRARH